MLHCVATNCLNKRVPGSKITFHRFPFRKPSLLKKWIANCQSYGWKPFRFSTLCSDHFEEHCFDRSGQFVRIKMDAVPSIFKHTNQTAPFNSEGIENKSEDTFLPQIVHVVSLNPAAKASPSSQRFVAKKQLPLKELNEKLPIKEKCHGLDKTSKVNLKHKLALIMQRRKVNNMKLKVALLRRGRLRRKVLACMQIIMALVAENYITD